MCDKLKAQTCCYFPLNLFPLLILGVEITSRGFIWRMWYWYLRREKKIIRLLNFNYFQHLSCEVCIILYVIWYIYCQQKKFIVWSCEINLLFITIDICFVLNLYDSHIIFFIRCWGLTVRQLQSHLSLVSMGIIASLLTIIWTSPSRWSCHHYRKSTDLNAMDQSSQFFFVYNQFYSIYNYCGSNCII